VTEVSFYHLQRRSLEETLPKLLERVMASSLRALVLAESEDRVDALSSRLWTYEQGSFLAHGTGRERYPDQQPIYLTSNEENPNQATVLVLVDERLPDFVGSFDRCLDLFDGNDDRSVLNARERWRSYKTMGHTVTYWQQDDNGRWKKKG
jgi:DNA polymerase-3 subunit chi